MCIRDSLRTWKRWATIFPPAVHHPHQYRAGGARKRHDSLLAERCRRAGRVPGRILAALLAVDLTALGEKCRSVCVGMTWRRLITTGAMRQWRPRLEEVNRQVRQFGVAVPGRVVHLGLRARTLHETGKLLVVTDCSNAFNTVKRTASLAEVANRVPAFTPFVAKCYGTRPADVFFRMDSRETRTIPCSSGVQQGDPMGPSLFWLAF